MSVVADFAYTGEDALNLVVGLARATDGRFEGPARTALVAVTAYAEAAANGFAALAYQPELSEPQRMVANALARGFREALGLMATQFPPGGTVISFVDLGLNDPANPSRLADFFGTNGAPLVGVTSGAAAALEFLRRDPLDLAMSSADELIRAMAAAAAGVTVGRP